MSTPSKVKKAFNDGKKAQLNGQAPFCPDSIKSSPEEAKAWYDGYYITYLVNRHKETFKKYGIKYP
jgi:hypothetical protein